MALFNWTISTTTRIIHGVNVLKMAFHFILFSFFCLTLPHFVFTNYSDSALLFSACIIISQGYSITLWALRVNMTVATWVLPAWIGTTLVYVSYTAIKLTLPEYADHMAVNLFGYVLDSLTMAMFVSFILYRRIDAISLLKPMTTTA